MGEVYLGHDTVLDRAVAIKLIGSRNPDAVSRERFLTEARAIARLSHPNVVTIYRVGTTGDGRPFLVQELIRGKSLDQVPRPMPWRHVCELAIGIARGLEAAHRRGILHRDVKPGNVMLDEHGAARLLDFGLAKLSGAGETHAPPAAPAPARDPGPASATPTRGSPRRRGAAGPSGQADPAETRDLPASADAMAETREAPAPSPPPGPSVHAEAAASHSDPAEAAAGPSDPAETAARPSDPAETVASPPLPPPDRTEPGTVIGTPRYTAPEIWRGEPSSVRSDLYALGVMLYELLAGIAPHPQMNLDELQTAALAGRIRPIGELSPEAHPVLARLVMRCLALDPRERPDAAASVAHELEAVIVGAPDVPEGNPYRGLRAFDAAHRGLFFGRGPDVDALVDRLRTEPLIVVIGDSGIGKSSACHAGVVPAVLAGALADRRTWRAVSIVPGRAPWAALCGALAVEADTAEALVRALRPAGDAGVLLVIDQLEELVTLAAPAEAVRAAEALAAIAAGVPGVKALLAVRGDFLTRVAALPELGAPMTRGLHLLRALSAADLREAVVGPARAKGVRYETDAMVDELVGAVAGNPGALPLLQFTLAELWHARDALHGVIPARALAQLGGVEGGLAGHADAVLLSLAAGPRAAARRILLRLVTAARTRAVRDRAELVGDDDVSTQAPASGAAASSRKALEREALESLVRGRLVVARDTAAGTPAYELAHEALIRSWGTLRDWLDEEAGQLAARNRLQAAASEWQRLERRPDLLWTRRQLDEIRDLGELTANERAFSDASRLRLRRRRLVRLAAIAAVSLAVLALAGVRFVNARARDQTLAAFLDAAQRHEQDAARLQAEALDAREDALSRFDADDDAVAEERWARALRLSADAHRQYDEAEAQLEAAFQVDRPVARPRIAALLSTEAELAELEHDDARLGKLLPQLALYDPDRASTWDQPGHLVLSLDRPARIALHAFRCFKSPADCTPAGPTIAGGFDRQPLLVREGAHLELSLPPGSYLAVIAPPEGTVVRAPFVIARGRRVEQSIAVPPAASAPPGFAYVPEGDFLVGSNSEERVRREIYTAQPLHRVRGHAFWISRTEVTFAQWLSYLRALPPGERRPHLPSGQGVSLDPLPDGHYALALEPSTNQRYRVAEGERLVYPGRDLRREVRWEQLPVSGISYVQARAYTAWLDHPGRLPGARVCTVREWEHAARGADGRAFPHGNALQPSEANFDETYGQRPSAYGPDEVGSFPASNSPYDVADLSGNVWELAVTARGRLWYRGGSFYQPTLVARSENMGSHADPNQANIRIGLRICVDAARAR